jgi:class 3 adenylate cyclase
MSQNRYFEEIHNLIAERESIFRQDNAITNRNALLTGEAYPMADNQWLKIPDVVCLFVDIRNSTGLSATSHDKSTASIYEFFTGTAVRMFHILGAGYIDIKGDGVFALFNSNEVHRAFAAAVNFKTFAELHFLPAVRRRLPDTVDIGFHMGMDQKTVLVKQIGVRDAEGRDRRKNEVWAGKPINMASKLASLSGDGELLVSDRYYNRLSDSDEVQKSCGCIAGIGQSGECVPLWNMRQKPEGSSFDFDNIYVLRQHWCEAHGKDWCERIIALD